ncbi:MULTISPECIES: radical SAM protein [unclassified Pseudomonas]|uniref:radical SAM protein n=1 Tax=unclassified Pseudomonas TaxID=196821 RepID=UPI000D3792EB|nr:MULTISPECIES: radical SAM protein [unclassified Pseudomonas]RAU45425.1 radical SAM protein [Pseudomonas sp. RIT 409]RAU53191.1 radical SAM protein [Pseudomonas sp. RIT 412]
MPCRILRSLYLRANGEIPCDDDFGEQINLGWIPKNGNFSPNEMFNNEKYKGIEEAFLSNTMPWGRICNHCALNRPTDPVDNHLRSRVISYFQIEPTLACALGCPGCSRERQIRQRPGPHTLALNQLQNLLDGLISEGYVVHNIEYCGQGEPLDHPQFSKIVDATRTAYPNARQRLITNGNNDYFKKLEGTFIDEIMVSIDGATQNSYEKYRIGGNLDTALNFTRNAKSSNKDQYVVWKYILFTHNDTTQEIELAESLAKDLGVDRLQFVRTHSVGKSVEWENRPLPLRWVNSIDTSTPLVERQNQF